MSDDTLRFVDETKQTQDTYSYLKPIGIRKLRKQINTKEFKKNYFVIDTRKEQPLVVHYDPNHVNTPQSAGGSTSGSSSTSSAPFNSQTNQENAPNKPIHHSNKRVQFSRNSQQIIPATHHQQYTNMLQNNSQMIITPQSIAANRENYLNSRRTLSMPEFLVHYSPPTSNDGSEDQVNGQLFDTEHDSHLFDQDGMMQDNENPTTSPIYRKSSIDCQFTPIDHQMNDGFISFLTPHSTMSPESEQDQLHHHQQFISPHQTIHHSQLLNKHFSMNDIRKFSNFSDFGNKLYNNNETAINILETLQLACSIQQHNNSLLLNMQHKHQQHQPQQLEETSNQYPLDDSIMQQSNSDSSFNYIDNPQVDKPSSPQDYSSPPPSQPPMNEINDASTPPQETTSPELSDLLISVASELFDNNDHIFSDDDDDLY